MIILSQEFHNTPCHNGRPGGYYMTLLKHPYQICSDISKWVNKSFKLTSSHFSASQSSN